MSTISLNVLLFGSIASLLSEQNPQRVITLSFKTENDKTVITPKQLREALIEFGNKNIENNNQQLSLWRDQILACALAVDSDYQRWDDETLNLNNSNLEIALIPPVSGG
jgi:hypothetical protein